VARRKKLPDDPGLFEDIPELLALLPKPSLPSMPYGEHEGKPLASIPRGYLAAVLENHSIHNEYGVAYCAMSDAEFAELKTQIKDTLSERGLPFGKFKNVPLPEVPSHYLNWLLTRENSRDYPTTRMIIKRELRHRRERCR
jgi:uncharacterized protein (DUF3820 family)